MVLGLKSKHKKHASIRVTYIVHVERIRPWPPSESLRSVQTVLLRWENGDQNSGSLLSVAGNSNIVFNESFMLPSTLSHSKKATDKYRKNYLEFSLFEPRIDKAKDKLLGTAVFNLADYGLMEDMISIHAPINFRKISSDSVQPALAISLEQVEKDSPNTSNNDGDDSEMTSLTDDDTSSHSSRTAGSLTFESASASPSPHDKNEYGNATSDTWRKVNDPASLSKFSERSMSYVQKNSFSPLIRSSPSSISFQDVDGKFNNIVASSLPESLRRNVITNKQHKTSKNNHQTVGDKRFALEALSTNHYRKDSVNSDSQSSNASQEGMPAHDAHAGWTNGEEKKKQKDTSFDELLMEETRSFQEKRLIGKLSEDSTKMPMRSDTIVPNSKEAAVPPSSSNKARLKHVMSLRVLDSLVGDTYSRGKQPDIDIHNGSQKKGKINATVERKESKNDKNEWKSRVEMLEEELREAAAIEVGLYSIVAEHSSSGNKVHAPARRLSRFYTNASAAGSQAKRASAARAAVSGLVLVSKACGNDVPRLTFWLSNSIMLRAIITQTAAELPHSNGPRRKSNGSRHELSGRLSDKWVDSSSHAEGRHSKSIEEYDDWEDVMTFIIALEKVESWLFSRIVESVWWQTFTPHMQPAVAKGHSKAKGSGKKKTTRKRNYLGIHEHGKFSMELWKKVFRETCQRLCPIRVAGHECGCLSALVVLVLKQLVSRFDVAMFNAILRKSAEETPTDPISDPIVDSKVLPVPAGKSSFGAGVQLKNVIGNWSRWLSDLFGLEDELIEDAGHGKRWKSFKGFRLLHALSDLMMLPFGMVADASTREEVCPMFGPTVIKRVLNNFVPDEFSPNPIPRKVMDALNSEEISVSSDNMITSLPCAASPTKYTPPPAALLTRVGEVGTQVATLKKKSHVSDDELDEVDSPLITIVPHSYQTSSALAKLSLMPKEKGGRNVVRYQLLREIWRDDM